MQVKQNVTILRLPERIAEGIEQGESHFREFKSAIDRNNAPQRGRDLKAICRDIGETLVAFANADGGELYVGVEDDGTVTGVPHKEELLQAMLEAPKSYVHQKTPIPNVTTSRVRLQDQTVLYFQTSKSTSCVHLTSDGRCLQRFDTENRPVAAEDIQYSRQDRASREYDRAYIDGATLADLDSELISRVSKLIAGGQSPEKFLQYLDLADYRAEGLSLRRAALLLFARDISKWHPRCQVRVARVSGVQLGVGQNYNINSREDHIVRANILRIREIAWDTLRPYLARTRLAQSGIFAESLVYPEDACLEALVNAVAHRDYSIEGKGIEILVFENRLEISSPGGLLTSISVAELKSGKRTHQSRNVYVARVLRELGYMREMGEGMLRIFATMRDRDLVPPEIKTDPSSFEIVLHHQSIFTPRDQEWLGAFASYHLNRDEQRTVLLGRDGLLSTNEIMKTLGIADTDEFRKLIEHLRRKGIVYNATESRSGGERGRSAKRWAIRPPDQVEQYRLELFAALRTAKGPKLDAPALLAVSAKLSKSSPYKEKLGESLKLLGLVDERSRPLPLLTSLMGEMRSRKVEQGVPVGPTSTATQPALLPMLGTIEALKQNGYGFIEGEDKSVYFFHMSDLVY